MRRLAHSARDGIPQVDSGRPEDGRPCHVSAFRKKSLYNEDSSPVTSQWCGWQNIGRIDFNNTEKQGNKSYPGNVIEHVWFDHPADNISAPDFPEAEVELKVSPIDIKKSKDGPSCIAGERLVLNTINYAKESTANFKTSSFWKKNRFIELMQYLRRIASEKGQSEDKRKYKIEYATF